MKEMVCRNFLSQIGNFSYLLRIFNPCLIHEGREFFIFNESIQKKEAIINVKSILGMKGENDEKGVNSFAFIFILMRKYKSREE